ncbi:MAG: oxidoreductase C-terminal domain-containing protein [Acetobacteraceae bacterium]
MPEPGPLLAWRRDPNGGNFIASSLINARIAAATDVNQAKEMKAARRMTKRCLPVAPSPLGDSATRLLKFAQG